VLRLNTRTTNDAQTADVDFDALKASPEVKGMINQLRVCSCLIAYVLIFIKHIPHCRPNLAFASLLTNKWDTILCNEYNLPRPSKRKRIKRRMMFELFAVESAVAEKFFLEESAVAYQDMRPNADGTLSAFCIDQLVDVIRALQRCVDHETIVNAWSHNLDHSPPTSAHVFQMKTVLSQLHGSGLDCHTFEGALPPPPQPAAAQHDDFNDDEVVAACERAERENADRRRAMLHGTGENDPLVPPTDVNGTPVSTTLKTKPMMQDGLTRAGCAMLSTSLAQQRGLRAEYSRRLAKRGARDANGRNVGGALDHTIDVFADGIDRTDTKMHRMASTGQVVDAAKAAAAILPTAQDALSSGVDDQFLKDILEGRDSNQFGGDLQMLGIRPKGWEFECTSTKSGARGPADYDFNWAMLSAFSKNKSGGGEDGGGQKKRSVWTNVARQVKQSVRTGGGDKGRAFSLMDIESMTFESMRDTLFLIGQPLSENKVRVSKHNFAQTQLLRRQSRMHTEGGEFDESTIPATVHPQHMYGTAIDPSTGKRQYDPEFLNPCGAPRLAAPAGVSDYQKRLDHFTNRRALAACVAPVAFEMDLPIKESETHNAIYFNKWIANEHAALVVEAGAYLAGVAGVAGGDYTKVPSSFRRQGAIRTDDDGRLPSMESTEVPQPQQPQPPPQQPPQQHARDAETSRAAARRAEEDAADAEAEAEAEADAARRRDPNPDTVQQDTMVPCAANAQRQREYEAENATFDDEQDEEEQEQEQQRQRQQQQQPMASDEVDDRAEGMAPLEKDVSDPGSEGSGLEAGPGVAAESARRSVEETADVRAMPYDWDMLQMFLTFKIVDTLHNDCGAHVELFAEYFPDVFDGEDKEDTLRDLPQLCTRFPGLKNKSEHSNYLFPISRAVSLTASRVSDLASSVNSKHVPRELAEAALSMAMGRKIRYNDPEVVDHEAESRGVDASAMLHGNLFSRSAWLNFTSRAMDVRGMGTFDENERAADQGLCLLLRTRNARAVAGHPERQKSLRADHELGCISFSAQERRMRERGIDAAGGFGRAAPKAAHSREQSERAFKREWEDETFRERMSANATKRPRNV